MADVAQLVEPRFVVPVVVSSSLIVRPIVKKSAFRQTFFVINFSDTSTFQHINSFYISDLKPKNFFYKYSQN